MLSRLDRLSLVCFALILLALSIHTVIDFDVGFHLRAGEQIWRTGVIPTRDLFSYVAEGRPWVDSQWLFQLILHGAHAAAGATGLIALPAVLVAIAFGALLTACHREGRPLALALGVALLAVFVSWHRFHQRPELLSLAFLAIFVLGSERFGSRPRAWLVALPLLQVIWTNSHGLAILGPVYLGLGFAGDALQALARRSAPGAAPDGQTGALAQRGALVLLCSLALLANANGWPGIRYPFDLLLELRGDVAWFPSDLLELRSPFGYAARSAPIAAYLAFALLTAAALAAGWRRVRIADVLQFAAFFYLSARAIRNIPLFAVVAAPIAVRSAARYYGARTGASTSRWIAPATCAALAAVTAATWLGVTSNALYRGSMQKFGIGVYEHVPADIVERLRALDGRFLNDAAIGGYLIWKLYPDKQVAVDGRWEVYGELMPGLRAAFREPDRFEAFVREYDVRAVVVSRYRSAHPATAQLLARSRDFQLVLRTPEVALYERRAAPGAALRPDDSSN